MKCFVCDKVKSVKKFTGYVGGKPVCLSCSPYLGNGRWLTPDREIQLMIVQDMRGRPSNGGGIVQ